jgi:plastocyanin
MTSEMLGGVLFVVLLLLLPFEVVANTATTVDGMQTADISFEATAPYYEPHIAVVSAGVPVRWSNSTASPHSIRHDGCLTDEGPCVFRSITVPPDNSFVIAPLPPGRYSYHCELHPVMRGTLVVVDSQTVSNPIGSLSETR